MSVEFVDTTTGGSIEVGFDFLAGVLRPEVFAFSFPGVDPVSFRQERQPSLGILDQILDVAKGTAQQVLRVIVPDPIEAAVEVFFPDISRNVLGPNVFAGVLRPPSTAGTPPFFPGRTTSAGTTDVGVLDPDLVDDFFETLPRDINAPGGGFGGFFDIPESPGIFDDIFRGIGNPGGFIRDVIPELIPAAGPILDIADLFFPTDELIDAGVQAFLPDEDVFEDPFLNPPFEGAPPMAEGEFTACPPGRTLPACMSYADWTRVGRPEGYTGDRFGNMRRRRHRRKRPLSQQAKDDLGWAKATFGQGKAFDNVVARMKF